MKQERFPEMNIDLFCKLDLEEDAASKTKKRDPSGIYKKMDEIRKNWKARNKMNNDLDRINEAMNKIPKYKKWKVFFPMETHKQCIATLHRYITERKFSQIVSVIPRWERSVEGIKPFYILSGPDTNIKSIFQFVHNRKGSMVEIPYPIPEPTNQDEKNKHLTWKVFFVNTDHSEVLAKALKEIPGACLSRDPSTQKPLKHPGGYYELRCRQADLGKIRGMVNDLAGKMESFGRNPEVEPAKQTANKPLLQFTFKKVVQEKTGTKGYVISGFVGKLYDKANLPLEYIQPGTTHFYKQGDSLWISGLKAEDLPGVRFDSYHKMHEITFSSFGTDLHFIRMTDYPDILALFRTAGERLTRINRDIRNKKRTWKGSVTVSI